MTSENSFAKRGWIIRIVVFLMLLAILFFLRSRSRSLVPSDPSSSQPSVSSVERHREWRSKVENILNDYDRTSNAAQARDGLLGLTVAPEDRDMHLKLVLAFQAVVDGASDASFKLQETRKEFLQP